MSSRLPISLAGRSSFRIRRCRALRSRPSPAMTSRGTGSSWRHIRAASSSVPYPQFGTRLPTEMSNGLPTAPSSARTLPPWSSAGLRGAGTAIGARRASRAPRCRARSTRSDDVPSTTAAARAALRSSRWSNRLRAPSAWARVCQVRTSGVRRPPSARPARTAACSPCAWTTSAPAHPARSAATAAGSVRRGTGTKRAPVPEKS